jgi:hypothetical protein
MWVSGHIAGWVKQYKLGASIQMFAPAPSRSQLPGWACEIRTQKCRRSHRFEGIQPNSGHGDQSRLSCGAGMRSAGPVNGALVLRSLICLAEMACVAAIRPIQRRSSAAKPATPLLSLRRTFRAKRACVVVDHGQRSRSLRSPPPPARRWAFISLCRWRELTLSKNTL